MFWLSERDKLGSCKMLWLAQNRDGYYQGQRLVRIAPPSQPASSSQRSSNKGLSDLHPGCSFLICRSLTAIISCSSLICLSLTAITSCSSLISFSLSAKTFCGSLTCLSLSAVSFCASFFVKSIPCFDLIGLTHKKGQQIYYYDYDS